MAVMAMKDRNRPVRFLLVEDNYGDVLLTQHAFAKATMANEITVARDGEIAMAMLRREGEYAAVPLPDLVLLDLNLPKMDGKEVLAAIKGDSALRQLPVIILSSSRAEQDVAKSYDLNANSYLIKPIDLTEFYTVVQAIESFWMNLVILSGEETR